MTKIIEVILGVAIAIGLIAYLLFLRYGIGSLPQKPKRRKVKKQKTKPPRKKETKEVDGVEIPKEWQKGNPHPKIPSTSTSYVKEGSRKIRVPGLLMTKRTIAGVLLLFNFFIAQATLMSAQATQPLYLLFILNAFILLDYIWKTRRKQTI